MASLGHQTLPPTKLGRVDEEMAFPGGRPLQMKEKSIIIKNIRKGNISSMAIEQYFKTTAEDNVDICKFISARKKRDVMVFESSCLIQTLLCACTSKKIRGLDFYEAEVIRHKTAIAEELNRLPKKILPIAFVTFKYEKDAKRIKNAHTQSFSDKMGGKWIFYRAPEPTNVIWEHMQLGQTFWNQRSICINLITLIIGLFLSTPTIVISSFQLDKIKEGIAKWNATISRFLLTLVIWILSLVIPALITYSSEFLEYKTKSAMYRSEMRKTVFFLIITVVILPSLGLTSVSDFFKWFVAEYEKRLDWSCIFFPENGAFFVDYIITTTFMGTTFQLLRLPDIICCIFLLLLARSEIERLSIRRDVPGLLEQTLRERRGHHKD
ncbi:calcium permeable stress-gated cation channel 1 [Trichonephila clavipes]|nr:calcium permeable stress-gated cation channel 1 [Trichonephila clavipes]